MSEQFHRFAHLPSETRLQIIRCAANNVSPETSRIVEVMLDETLDDDVKLETLQIRRRGLSEPAIYLVNWECRVEARKQLVLFLGRSVNLNTDIFHIDGDPHVSTVNILKVLPLHIRNGIRNIAFISQLIRANQLTLYSHADAKDLKTYLPSLLRILLVFEVEWAHGRRVNTIYRPVAANDPVPIYGKSVHSVDHNQLNMMIKDFHKVMTPEWDPEVQFMVRRLLDAITGASLDLSTLTDLTVATYDRKAEGRARGSAFKDWAILHVVRLYRHFHG
jgi:hypothetical protein